MWPDGFKIFCFIFLLIWKIPGIRNQQANPQYDKNLNCLKECKKPLIGCESAPKRTGIYLIKPDVKSKPFYVECESDSERSWTVIQRRMAGSENFNRNWKDYKKGFGNLTGEYWLGLERMHKLTRKHIYELKITIRSIHGSYELHYSRFYVSDEHRSFRLHVGYKLGGNSYRSSEDPVIPFYGNKFATFDKPNEGYNCASLYKTAWWFEECERSYDFTKTPFQSVLGLNGPPDLLKSHSEMAIRQPEYYKKPNF